MNKNELIKHLAVKKDMFKDYLQEINYAKIHNGNYQKENVQKAVMVKK